MATPTAPQSPFSLDLTPTMGALFIGVLIAAVFHGITTLQTIFYYSTYPDDKRWIKVMVAAIWVLDTVSLVLFSHAIYSYVILDYANPLALATPIWSFTSERIATAFVALIVKEFLIYRLYALNKKLMPFCAAMATLVLLPISIALYSAAWGLKEKTWESLQIKWTIMVAEISSPFIDIVIALGICLELRRGNTGFLKTRRMIHTLTAYTISSGALTSLNGIAIMITMLSSNGALWAMLFYASNSKAYANALLASLNCRQIVRGRGLDSTVVFADQQWQSGLVAAKNPSAAESATQATYHLDSMHARNGGRAKDMEIVIGFESNTVISEDSQKTEISSQV